MKDKMALMTIVLITALFFIPYLIKPELLTTRDNDLGRTYIPLFNFYRQSFYETGQIPLWRPDQMMGENLAANPISALFYPLNSLFLILPIHFGAIVYLFLHFLAAGIFTYFLARDFKLSKISSLSAALFYAFSTKMLVHLEAGHITMIAAFSYFPLAFLAVRKLISEHKLIWLMVGSIALSFILVTYLTIFYYAIIFLILYVVFRSFRENFKKSALGNRLVFNFSLLIILTFGLSAIFLIPQLEFAPLSTRSTLRIEDVALPLWNLKKLITSLFLPYTNLGNLDHESFLYLGLVPSLLALLGFWQLSKVKKILLIFLAVLILLYISGLSTPFFSFVYKYLPLVKYSRVTTRLWFVVALIAALLAALGLEKIKNKKVIYLLIIVFLTEVMFIFNIRLKKIPNLKFENLALYQFLGSDRDYYRVYCTTYCFNPQLLSKYKIQILNGETPIQDQNFINFLKKAGNYQFDHFAVIFPPYQVWQTPNPPIPNAYFLGKANVKYVASTYMIEDSDFSLINKYNNIYLYQNLQFKPRVYFETGEQVEIKKSTANSIDLTFEKSESARELILSENYYPGWYAFANNRKVEIERQEPIFRKVLVEPNTSKLEIKFLPKSLELGKTITFSTIILLLLYLYRHPKKVNNG